MRYGIVVNGKVTEPVDIPSPLPAWAPSVLDFLAKIYPGKTGWKLVSDTAVPGTIDNGDGTFTNPVEPIAAAKMAGLSYDDFRKLFTAAESLLIDNYDTDAFITGAGLTALKVAEKAQMRNLTEEAKATGSGPRGINLASVKMSGALDFLVARGFIAAGRKAEIVSGVVKN